jgi:hypothetical protein
MSPAPFSASIKVVGFLGIIIRPMSVRSPFRYIRLNFCMSFSSIIFRVSGCGFSLTYRVTQVLTGHGYFRKYLHRIGRVASTWCRYCAGVHSDRHAPEHCPAWAAPRRALTAEIGLDPLPSVMLRGAMRLKRSWDRGRGPAMSRRIILPFGGS